MQLILFSKHFPDPDIPFVKDPDRFTHKPTLSLMTSNGTICIVSQKDYQASQEDFRRLNYINCGIKDPILELYRALRLDEKKDHDRIKRVIFNTKVIGAFKNAFSHLFFGRYAASDPACLIIIPDVIFSAFLEEIIHPKIKRLKSGEDEDPILNLIRETEKNPIVKEISQTYIGTSFGMRFARAMILKASQSKAPVLILGESGTGKDVIAHQIVKFATMNKEPFKTINCSTLQDTLFESELFGHMKGSYSSASETTEGLFASVDGGTIFLDEIGDLSLNNQAKLLLAIDKMEIRAVGSTDVKKINVRVLAATNRNIDAMVLQGKFREDLHHRLNFFRIYAPSVRSHPDDIPAIANFLWGKLAVKRKLTPAFLNYLKSYSWPGNVRELKALLTSIVDIWGDDISPTPKYVDSIRSGRQQMMTQSANQSGESSDGLFILEARNRLITLQNVMRGIKIRLRPVINHELKGMGHKKESQQLKTFISEQIVILDDLSAQPSYFINWELFQKMTRYRYVLEKTVNKWPADFDKILGIWNGELMELDNFLNRGILDIIWEKITVINQKSR